MLGGGEPQNLETENTNGPKELVIEVKTQLWSKEKMSWIDYKNRRPELPNNFSMINGCVIPLNRTVVLLIGGHHTKQFNSQPGLYSADKTLPNNQVLLYTAEYQTWTWFEDIPYHQVSCLLLIHIIVLHLRLYVLTTT